MKYALEQLKQMARQFLEARNERDPRAALLMDRLMARTGLSESQCLLNIIMLA